jgi:hypothetical protein
MCAHQNELYPSPFKYKLAMHHDQFIFSSSWLPGLRFELRTLAGYAGLLPSAEGTEMSCGIKRGL